jgi:hypothetical protein
VGAVIEPECHICQGGHSDELHQSTLRLRRWMIRKVDLAAPPVAKPRVFVPPSDVVNLALPTPEARRRASRLGGRAQGRR